MKRILLALVIFVISFELHAEEETYTYATCMTSSTIYFMCCQFTDVPPNSNQDVALWVETRNPDANQLKSCQIGDIHGKLYKDCSLRKTRVATPQGTAIFLTHYCQEVTVNTYKLPRDIFWSTEIRNFSF